MTDERSMASDDLYSRVDYRRFVAWPQRIEREWPFLERALARAPSKRLIDLGCGTGEHARFLAARGFEVTGIDASSSMLDRAREAPAPGVRFVEGDITEVASLLDGEFGGAICLGNTLPHIRERQALDRLLGGLRVRLAPGAPLVIQILNYEKILGTTQRYLPLNFRADEDGEVVFLRLMDPRADGTVIFTPSTLRYRPDGDPPVEIVSARNVLLHGWTTRELEEALDGASFPERELYGSFGLVAYDSATSPDLVIVAR